MRIKLKRVLLTTKNEASYTALVHKKKPKQLNRIHNKGIRIYTVLWFEEHVERNEDSIELRRTEVSVSIKTKN